MNSQGYSLPLYARAGEVQRAFIYVHPYESGTWTREQQL